MRHILLISTLFLLTCCDSGRSNRGEAVGETRVQEGLPTNWMYADIDPFVKIDGMQKSELIQLFAEMQQADQQWRDSLNLGRKENEMFFLKKMSANDEANLKILNNIIQKHGWPGKSVFGESAAETAWLIIWHHRGSRRILCQHFDLMQKAVNAGEMHASYFQHIKDQVEALSSDGID